MKKTLVNIVTDDDPIAAYLFVKEMYSEGDELMFISAKNTEDDMSYLIGQLRVPEEQVQRVSFPHRNDEYLYEHICRELRDILRLGVTYYVNLAGGTRYMALAVQQAFEKFSPKYFYTNVKENVIVSTIYNDSIDDDDDRVYPIRYRMTVPEYLAVHNLTHDYTNRSTHQATKPRECSGRIFEVVSMHRLSNEEYGVFEKLREGYRNDRSSLTHRSESSLKRRTDFPLDEIAAPRKPHWTAIPCIKQFLQHIDFKLDDSSSLSRREVDFLTGGWFEEYVYYWMKATVKPDDIATGVHISHNVADHDNELDVVFTKNNRLFVIECKSGISTKSLFNEIIYKACALKKILLGVSCHFYLCSLRKDDDGTFGQIADSMGITFIDQAAWVNPRKRTRVSAAIRSTAERTIR